MNIRKCVWGICLLAGLQVLQAAEKSESDYLLIGSYTPAEREGLALYRLNQETADVERVSGLAGILNPSFLTPNPEKGWYMLWEKEIPMPTQRFIRYLWMSRQEPCIC